jgi:hypothetical protein
MGDNSVGGLSRPSLRPAGDALSRPGICQPQPLSSSGLLESLSRHAAAVDLVAAKLVGVLGQGQPPNIA